MWFGFEAANSSTNVGINLRPYGGSLLGLVVEPMAVDGNVHSMVKSGRLYMAAGVWSVNGSFISSYFV